MHAVDTVPTTATAATRRTGGLASMRPTGQVTLDLPVPPSLNGLFRNVAKRGRVRTARYNAWDARARADLAAQMPDSVVGTYALDIALPRSARGDLDNYPKAVSDLLVDACVVVDDALMERLTVFRDARLTRGRCRVTVTRCPVGGL